MYFSEGNNNLEAGILRVNSYINRGKLKVFKSCTNIIREMLGYKYPEVSMDDEKDPDEKPIKRADHMPDAIRYMFMRLPEDPDMLLAPHYDVPDRYTRADAAVDLDDEEFEDMPEDYLAYV